MQATTASAQAPDVEPTTQALAAVLRHLVARTEADLFREVERLGLSFSQIKCLRVLVDHAPASVGGVSDEIGLSLPAVSRAIDCLVQRGLVKRIEDPEDRRAKRLTLTAAGRKTFAGLLELRLAGIRAFVDSLEAGEREALDSGLRPLMQRPEIAARAPGRQS
jgi:DNA-binding MarR family transcriptional regulator